MTVMKLAREEMEEEDDDDDNDTKLRDGKCVLLKKISGVGRKRAFF